MAIKINFANGEYNTSDFNEEFGAIVGKNIVVGTETSLKVTQSSPLGLKVNIGSGKCFVNGQFVRSTSTETLNVEGNLSGAIRKDIVVFSLTTKTFLVKKGTATAPTPTSSEILLAEISVKNNALSIADSDIADKRTVRESVVSNCEVTTVNNFPYYQQVRKYSDGRLEITMRRFVDVQIMSPWGGGFVTGNNGIAVGSYLVPFIENEPVTFPSIGSNASGNAVMMIVQGKGNKTTPPKIDFFRPAQLSGITTMTIQCITEGHWR